MVFVLGVDGGATKTIALVATATGEIVGSGRRAGSSIYEGDPEAMLENAIGACNDALAMAGILPASIAASVFSMAGADWPEDFSLIHTILAEHGMGRRMTIVNDAVGGLWAGSTSGPAVAIICGTGAGTAARNREGKVWHSSFWQVGGGAVQLADKALKAVFRAHLEIDRPTKLTAEVLAFTGCEGVESLLHRLTARNGVASSTYAGLARVLLDVATAGDPVARAIVGALGTELADSALAAARQVGIEREPFELVLGGSVFRHPEPLLVDAIVTRVTCVSPSITVVRSAFEPVVGALLLGYDATATGDASTVAVAIENSWMHHRDRVLAIPLSASRATSARDTR